MARPTVAQLQTRIDELESCIAELQEQVAVLQNGTPTIQYVRELKPPESISEPIDFAQMSLELSWQYAQYSEAGDVWGPGTYL